jgi:hypothetical protein
LAQARVVLLGETHDDAEHHRWQLHTIAGLHALRPNLVLGFEMFPRRVQPALDAWAAGRLTDQEFLRQSDWPHVWGYDSGLYLPLFHFTRLHRIPMLALNVERQMVSRVRGHGWAAVPDGEREGVTNPAPASREYTAALHATYREHETQGSDAAKPEAPPSAEELEAPAFRRFVEAQQVWDRAMAQGIAERQRSDPGALIVGIMGSGHLRHGHGVPYQLRALGVESVAVALPWNPSEGCADLTPTLADVVFGIETRQAPPAPERPRLGIRFERGEKGATILEVESGSVAEAAGIRKGDVIVQIAGAAVGDTQAIVRVVRSLGPGLWLPLQVRRGDETLELIAKFPARP